MNKDPFLFFDVIGKIDDSILASSFLPWNNQKKNLFQKYRIAAACILLSFLFIGSLVFHTEVKATFLKVRSYISEILGSDTDLSPYTEIQNIPVTQNGLTLTLEEVVLDNNVLMLLVSQKFEDSSEETILHLESSLKINGQEASKYLKDLIGSGTKMHDQKFLLKYYFDMNTSIPDPLNIEVCFKASRSDNHAHIGTYNFLFTASRKELEANTIRKRLDQTYTLSNGATLHLTLFKYNTLESIIMGRCENLPLEYTYALKGTDNLGNQVLYSFDTYEKPKILFISDWNSYISPEVSSIELQLCRRKDILLESIPDSMEGKYTEGGYLSEPGEWEAISESFLISLKPTNSP